MVNSRADHQLWAENHGKPIKRQMVTRLWSMAAKPSAMSQKTMDYQPENHERAHTQFATIQILLLFRELQH